MDIWSPNTGGSYGHVVVLMDMWSPNTGGSYGHVVS